jgi:hypothetical protein
MCVLIFSTTVAWQSNSKRNWARYDQNLILVFMYSELSKVWSKPYIGLHVQWTEQGMIKTLYWSSRTVPVILVRLKKLEFSQQIFEKYSNIKFSENLSSESQVVLCGRKDGRTCRS